ncbi:MAG: hypothetical protein ACK55Z_08970, partial [bacterium]
FSIFIIVNRGIRIRMIMMRICNTAFWSSVPRGAPTKRPSSKGQASKGPGTNGPASKGPGY